MRAGFKVLHNCLIWLPVTQNWMYNMLSHLPDYIETTIVCAKTKNLAKFNVGNIYSKKRDNYIQFAFEEGLKRIGLINYSFLLKRRLKETNAFILHSHFGDRAWEDSHIKKKQNFMHIAHFYGYDVSLLPASNNKWEMRYQQLFERVDKVLCEGSFMANSLKKLGCPKDKVRVYHLGVEVDKLPFIPRVWDKKSNLKVLIAGSFREKKGIPYALEALAKLKNKIKLEVNIIGDTDGQKKHQREKEKIIKVAREHNMMDIINWHGMVDHATLIQEALRNHIFISPSVTARNGDSEGGCPVTIIELSATGMPVISTKHCDIPEVVLDGKTGFLSSERDVNGLYENLIKLLNSENWDEMANMARMHIRKNYNAKIQGEKLAEIYEELLGRVDH